MKPALLFDMDGLLLDTERVALEAFVDVAETLETPKATELFLSLVGSSETQTRASLTAAFGASVDMDVFGARWNGAFRDRLDAGVPVKDGVRAVLTGLAERKATMIVVTSTQTANAQRHLEKAGLLGHFVDVIGGDMVTANKPDPAPYLLGAERAGREADTCFAFDDSDKGVTSAVAAGCKVWQVPDLRPVDVPLPRLGQQVAADLASAVSAAGLL